jgi:hypothetical protein
MREERERLQEAGHGSVEPMACHSYADDGERRPRSGRGLSAVVRWRGARTGEHVGADTGWAGLPS